MGSGDTVTVKVHKGGIRSISKMSNCYAVYGKRFDLSRKTSELKHENEVGDRAQQDKNVEDLMTAKLGIVAAGPL